MSEFSELLQRVVATFPSRSALAKALDLNASRLSRALNTGDYPFNVENCLRLAQLSGESPSVVLRAAGKGEIAGLLETLYGHDRNELLSDEERELLDYWNRLSSDARAGLRALLSASAVSIQSRAVPKSTGPVDASARGGAARRDAAHGQEFVEVKEFVGRPPPGSSDADAQRTPVPTAVPRAQRAREIKEAAAIDRLTRAAEQAEPMGGSPAANRATRQHAAAIGARASARRPRAGKHRR